MTRKIRVRSLTLTVLFCFTLAATWVSIKGWPSNTPRDYEECSENASAGASSKDEREFLIGQCSVRFAARRKAAGGYTYHDFMQNRHFDIVGPNPSPEELKLIDHEYTTYLDALRQNAIAEALAKKQSDQKQADLEKSQQLTTGSTSSVGPPMVITPTNLPAASAKKPAGRSTAATCEDGSLSCNWSKFSTTVKNVFNSSQPKP